MAGKKFCLKLWVFNSSEINYWWTVRLTPYKEEKVYTKLSITLYLQQMLYLPIHAGSLSKAH